MYIHQDILDSIDRYKQQGKFSEALKLVNSILIKDPNNQEALIQVADIEYRKGEISNAQKPIDYLLKIKGETDPMSLYIKGVLEMEKNNRIVAKNYLQKALELSRGENHEIVRCYGLCEYRYGNREKGILMLENSFHLNSLDAEIIYNLVEIYLLENRYSKAKTMIKYYFTKQKKLLTFDKEIAFYDNKINLFQAFLNTL
ncbi:MAG TPA: hypothetical protein PKC14_03070 [Candidatus Absconditabacterales bacterium]|nr:hypothetical protein [Candidatus Absconditabacterales bacterium]